MTRFIAAIALMVFGHLLLDALGVHGFWTRMGAAMPFIFATLLLWPLFYRKP